MAGGRPTIIDELVLQKLEEAFSLGCTDKEACVLANIAPATLYNYQNNNPEFVERKNQLKEKPILKARRTVVESLDKDINSAWRYLERKDDDFNPKAKIDHTSGGEKIEPAPLIEHLTLQLNAIYKGTGESSDGGLTRALGLEASNQERIGQTN